MFIDKNAITINGINMGDYILSAKFGYYKLWGKDSGRNLAGSNSGTLIGIFPKITLQFRKLSKSEVEYLAPTLDSANQSTSYYDANKKQKITISTYSGDWVLENKSIIDENHKNEGFEWSVISNHRRQ
jgi:hypothetical protein